MARATIAAMDWWLPATAAVVPGFARRLSQCGLARRKTGSAEIPAITGDAGEMIGYLDRRYSERADAVRHRRRAGEGKRPTP